MTDEILREIRKTCVLIGVFTAVFVFMYLGVALIIKSAFIFFVGFMPYLDKLLLRLIFYATAGLSVLGLYLFRRRRYSEQALANKRQDIVSLIKHVMNTVIWSMSLSLGPAISGFFIFALGNLLLDFIILAVVSLALIYLNLPSKKWLEQSIAYSR